MVLPWLRMHVSSMLTTTGLKPWVHRCVSPTGLRCQSGQPCLKHLRILGTQDSAFSIEDAQLHSPRNEWEPPMCEMNSSRRKCSRSAGWDARNTLLSAA